jgi:hypothetical protein
MIDQGVLSIHDNAKQSVRDLEDPDITDITLGRFWNHLFGFRGKVPIFVRKEAAQNGSV